MISLHEAAFYQTQAHGRVRCLLCPHHCRIAPQSMGACGVRVNHAGRLYTLAYGKAVARLEAVEKKPFFHFVPGSTAFSVATAGCNLACAYCHNWQISQWPKTYLRRIQGDGRASGCRDPGGDWLTRMEALMPGRRCTPTDIVDAAVRLSTASVAYTFTEPAVLFEYAYDTAVLARRAGLKNLLVSGGYIDEAPLRQIAGLLDAANIDLKFFSDRSYRRISRGRLAPVLDTIRLLRHLGVWVELTTLVIPGVNDSDVELRAMAEFIHSVGPEVPWHLSRFQPAYRMTDRPATPPDTLTRAARIGRDAGLRHVYVGNAPEVEQADTFCHDCGSMLIHRCGFAVGVNRVAHGHCPDCGTWADGVDMDGLLSASPYVPAENVTDGSSEAWALP